MLNLSPPAPGLLFGSFLFRADFITSEELKVFWEKQFGPGLSLLPTFNPLSEYYTKEMGAELLRIFFLTTQTFPRESLLSTKLLALDWERNWAQEERRRVNVDIGFLTLENFILATTKNFSHRIYLGENIFADLTYQFTGGKMTPLPWTYPDYLDEEKKNFFSWARGFLLIP